MAEENLFQFKRVWRLNVVVQVVLICFLFAGMTFAVTILFAPIFEELIFRGWILDDLAYQMIYATLVVGPLLGYMALKAKTIWPGVILHYLNNIGSLVLMVVSVDWRTLF